MVTKKQIEEKIVFGLNGMSHEDIKSANEKQVSGTHYKGKSIQPWDYIASNNLGYFEGNCVKYVSRWKDKGGVADLHKAIHYLEKLIELTEGDSK